MMGPRHESFDFKVEVLHPMMSQLQWPFQDPRLEVPTIYKAYVREYPHKIWPYYGTVPPF